MKLPQNKEQLSEAINTIIEVWQFNIGAIDEDKSLHFSIEETSATFKVKFEFITAIIPVPEPERDEIIWGDDFFVILKTEPMKKLIHNVNDICEMINGLTIGNEKQTPFDY